MSPEVVTSHDDVVSFRVSRPAALSLSVSFREVVSCPSFGGVFHINISPPLMKKYSIIIKFNKILGIAITSTSGKRTRLDGF